MQPEVQEKAEKFALLLRASPAFLTFRETQEKLRQDQVAQTLLRTLELKQREFQQKQFDGGLTQEDIDEIRSLQKQIGENEQIIDFLQAQEEAISFAQEINLVISELLGFDFGTWASLSAGSC